MKDEQGARYIDSWGETVYSCGQANAQAFSEGLFLVEKEGGWRFLNLDGSDALGRAFEEVTPFTDGLAWTRQQDLSGLVDVFGNMLLPYQYEDVHSPYKGFGWIIAYRSEEDFEVFTPDGRPAEIDWRF